MSLRVVVVEDETLTRIDLIEILKENGYDVVGEATDGIEAVEICKKLQPDIVLLDIKIPYISGLKVANILKEDGFKGCIIILTAYNIAEYIQEASNTIVMGYILKPIDESIFLERLKLIKVEGLYPKLNINPTGVAYGENLSAILEKYKPSDILLRVSLSKLGEKFARIVGILK